MPHGQQLTQALSDNRDEIVAFFSAVAPEQWEQTVYKGGANWTVQQVLSHFVAAEQYYYTYISSVLQGEAPSGDLVSSSPDFGDFDTAAAAKMQDMAPKALIEAFSGARQQLIDLTATLSEADLARPVHYPPLAGSGVDDCVEEMLKMLLRHIDRHRSELERATTHP